MVGQQQQLQLETVFQYELCAVPSSLFAEYCCLRKSNKAVLANRLGVLQRNASAPGIIIVDAQQLLYHVTWPHGGDAAILVESMKHSLSHYPADSQKILVFDKYDVSAKDHERMRRAGEGSTYYNLTMDSPIPNGGAIMKNNHNKRQLSRFISCSNLGANITLKSRHDGGFSHDEADITMIAYLVQEAECD